MSWINISIVRSSQVKDLELDTHEWGDYTIVADYLIDEDEQDNDGEQDTSGPALYQIHIRQNTLSRASAAAPKLRSASDVLSRLRWDPDFSSSGYVVGYEDRFLGLERLTLRNERRSKLMKSLFLSIESYISRTRTIMLSFGRGKQGPI